MAVKSHSFQEKIELTQNTEKISSVADPINAREGAPFMEHIAAAFTREIMDEKIKDAEEGTGSQNPLLQRAGGWLLEERGVSPSSSGRDCRSRSVSRTSRSRSSSSSVSSGGSSYSSGRRGDRRRSRRRRSHYRSRRRSSSSRSRSRSRSRPRPRCHRDPSCSRRCRGRRRSPPRRYRARSRSYSPSYSPVRRHRRRSPPRSRSRSRERRAYGVVGRSRFSLERRPRTRSRSRSRSPDRTSVHLSLQEKKQLLLITKENAARALGVEDVALPASVNAGPVVQEEPAPGDRVSPGGSALNSLRENYEQTDAEQEVACPKMSHRNKISFSINNSVAKPATGRSSSSPEKTAAVRAYSATGHKTYGHWVPVKARSFPLSASKRSPTRSR